MRPDFLPENAVPFNNVYLVNVTPELAQNWLDGNEFNQPCCQHYVDRLAEQMKSGRWQHRYHNISFDKNGKLLNGRHRLLAVIQSGQTIQMLIATDIDCQ